MERSGFVKGLCLALLLGLIAVAHAFSVPERKSVNLTKDLGVRFWNEDHDTPGR